MAKLIKKFKALFVIIRPVDAIINSLIVMFSISFIANNAKSSNVILGGLAWLFISFANAIIKEYYETVKLKLIFPNNILSKEIISPAEAMAYYTYFTLSAILLSTFIGTFPMALCVAITLFNQYSCKKCRKNPYRFPFSRGIIMGTMIIYSTITYTAAKTLLFPAALLCIMTYIFTFIEYSRYYEEITDNLAKSFLSFLIPLFIFICILPFIKKWYAVEYLYAMIPVLISLVYVLKNIFSGYKNSKIDRMVWLLKFNLLVIIFAVYTGLK